MQIEPQRSPELTRLGALLEPMSVAMLTSVGADGVLASRPMSALEMDGQGVLWFLTDLRSHKVGRLAAVNLTFSDPDRASYVSLSGRAEVAADRAHIERLWTPFAYTWFPDGPDSTHLGLLRFVPDAAEHWDAPRADIVHVTAAGAATADAAGVQRELDVLDEGPMPAPSHAPG